jgi:ion channel-forming bestrophin family protein
LRIRIKAKYYNLPVDTYFCTMIAYNPKDWFSFIFKLHKADTIRALFTMLICIGLYTAAIAWLEISYWHLNKDSNVKNLNLLHNMLGFVLSLLLVFRTNTAYDRWWEGRKLWGSLVNNSRNLAIKLNFILDDKDTTNRNFFTKTIPAFALALRKHLAKESTRLALDELNHPELLDIDKEKHIPNQIASIIAKKINKLYIEKKISDVQLINLNTEVSSFTDICGACERIKNTPIPISYSVFVKKFIFFYIMTLPFAFVMHLGYYAIPVVVFIFYVLASLEMIAEEIEDPFGTDSNDLPTQKIAENIKKHVAELL